LLFLTLLGGLSGCNYHMVNQSDQFVGGYKLVAIPVFKNQSTEPKIEVLFTNALRRELRRSKIAQVTEVSQAPITVEGVIDSVQYIVVGQSRISTLPSSAILGTEYRINLELTLQVRRNADQEVLWTSKFRNGRSYLAPQIGTESINSANALYNQSARLQNIEVMAQEMMSEALNRMTENF
jgi:hypothetical protein